MKGQKLLHLCKHGILLYGTKCLNCQRDKREREAAIKALQDKAKRREKGAK